MSAPGTTTLKFGSGLKHLCVYCGHRSKDEAESKRHRNSHPIEERVAVCPFCDREFYNNGHAFLGHQRTHMGREGEAERFWPRVLQDDETGCWEWQGSKDWHDYGRFSYVGGKYVRAHQWAYEYLEGPVPEGLELDHLCCNSSCCNPGHLEPVTHEENIRRGHKNQPRAQCDRCQEWFSSKAAMKGHQRLSRICVASDSFSAGHKSQEQG